MPIAILSAMEEENTSLVEQMSHYEIIDLGRRRYFLGELFGHEVVVVFSHWGKVAASSTATALITRFDVSEILFTGVAGGIDRSLNVGDIVVATQLYQHDMDARPLIDRHEIPLLGIAAIPVDPSRQHQLLGASTRFVQTRLREMISNEIIDEFSLQSPEVVSAAIASGDQFISSEADVEAIRQRLPDVVCVEMEGGAVAQVCTEFGIPFSVVRTISDSANEQAAIDFPEFIKEAARLYSLGIVRCWLEG